MQSKILMSCLMAGVLIASSVASRAQETNAPATTPPGAAGTPNVQGMPPQGAQPRMRPLPGAGAGGPMSVLTEEQRASYQKNMTDKRAEMMELTSKLQPLRQELSEMLFSPKVDENEIRQKVMDEAKIEADIMILRAKAFAEIQPPMTDEQLEKFKEAQAPRQMMRPPPTAPSPSTNNAQGGAPGKP